MVLGPPSRHMHTYPVGTDNCHIDINCIIFHLSHFRTANFPVRETQVTAVYACLLSLLYIIFYAHCNNIVHQAARLVLENVTIDYTQVHC